MPKDNIRQKHSQGFEDLNKYWSRMDALDDALQNMSKTALSCVEEPIERVLEKIRAFELSVSIIGQVKAGKSTLLNALVDQTDLLPSDVNPCTSVITSLHLNNRHRPSNTRTLFRFFDQDEWDRLIATGGRLGEMAERAGFETEADEIRSQIADMRETTEARLGDEFNELIGSSRAYPDIDPEIINRYIRYSDPSESGESRTDGVYADITKSADLYLDVDGLPRGLCLRDTPGVNDTFMMREQITLNSISDSRVCVVVLSAHQALSNMDMALLRIMCAVEAREVLIFVNRIDELSDPLGEQDNIRKAIGKTLARLGLDDEIEILFGSAYWANFALAESGDLNQRSLEALVSLHPDADLSAPDTLRDCAYQSSGVPQLHRTIARRVIDGPGTTLLKDVENEIETIIEMSETVDSVVELRRDDKASSTMSNADLMLKVAEVLHGTMTDFDKAADELRVQLRDRLERAQQTFVASAVETLQSHMTAFGETGSWEHDPAGLRMTMKTAFATACSKLRREGETGFETVLDGIQNILQRDLGVSRKSDSIDFPVQPQHKAPTVLARTIALDLGGGWWQNFLNAGGPLKLFRIGGARKVEKKYRALLIKETTPLIDELLSDFFEPAVAETRDIITAFALDQGKFCEALLERLSDETSGESGTQSNGEPLQDVRRFSA